VLAGRVALGQHENPSVERPATAKASLDLSGMRVRAQVAAPTVREAIDRLEARLERQLEIAAERQQSRKAESGLPAPGAWRHGSIPTHRPAYFDRPSDERQVVRRKAFEYGEATPLEAALDMELLDNDFHLFRNADTGLDTVVYRRADGSLALLEPAAEETVAEATERLEVTGHRFVFFRDAGSGRGQVLYHRYDGHYGLLSPA
jgi:hypothetical protein